MASRWRAEIRLDVAQRDGRAWVDRCEHEGPLRMQRAFFPEGQDCPHVYLLHPPGGVVAGDRLAIHCRVLAGARTLLTTPGAAKFYRSQATEWSEANAEDGQVAEQLQELSVEGGGFLEWLPQEAIFFDGACAVLTTRIRLSEGASVAAWDILCLGRPGSSEPFRRGRVKQRFELWRGTMPVLIERGDFNAESGVLTQRWGLGGHAVLGTFVWACSLLEGKEARRSGGAEDELLQRVRDAMKVLANEQVSVSWLRDCLVLRYLGPSTERAKHVFTQAWTILRPALFQREPCVPRIWAT